MALIRIDLAETLLDGMDIKFQAPCDCSAVTGLVVYYPAEDGDITSKEFTFRDAHGNDLTGLGNLFARDSYVKLIADTTHGYAYLQNAATNGYLNSAIFGTYTHEGENLTGSGQNGKFKATASETISTINVNGVNCSVKCGEESSMDLVAGCWYMFILDGNTVNFSSGGAGAGLNFKVVGGTAEPVSPSENTIWANTDTAISSYVFAAAEPSDPVEGMVWISTGTASTVTFNALKKNGVMVYPMSAKQYIDGAWVDVTAKSYLSGEWVDWTTYFYKDGNTFDDLTGGYFSTNIDTQYGTGTVTFETNKISLVCDGAAETVVRTENKVELSNSTTLNLKLHAKVVSNESRTGHLEFYATENSITSYKQDIGGGVKFTHEYSAGTDGDFTVSLDVSSITGSKYIFVSWWTGYKIVDAYLDILEIGGQ